MAEKKVYIWTTPRSLSCALLRACMSRDKAKGYMEPWLYSYYLSSDRLSNRFGEKPNKPNSTFWERKKMLEDPHKGFREVFVRENGYRLRTFLEKGTVNDVLPTGFVHTFLIRNPEKVIPSLYQGSKTFGGDFGGFDEHEATFDELMHFHEYVTKNLRQKSIVVDADDLQQDPEETLKLFCKAVGIDYQETMVKWRPLNPQQLAEFEEWRPWVDRVLNSSGFS